MTRCCNRRPRRTFKHHGRQLPRLAPHAAGVSGSARLGYASSVLGSYRLPARRISSPRSWQRMANAEDAELCRPDAGRAGIRRHSSAALSRDSSLPANGRLRASCGSGNGAVKADGKELQPTQRDPPARPETGRRRADHSRPAARLMPLRSSSFCVPPRTPRTMCHSAAASGSRCSARNILQVTCLELPGSLSGSVFGAG